MPSKWLEWKPILDTFDTPGIGENPIIHTLEDENGAQESPVIEKTHIPAVSKVPEIPTIPKGIRLISWEPKPAPLAIDVCSTVTDVPKFIERELRALDSRLNDPCTIHGGFTVSQILDRLAQAGLDVVLEPKGGSSATKCQNAEGGGEIK
jgi:hypothetical protein